MSISVILAAWLNSSQLKRDSNALGPERVYQFMCKFIYVSNYGLNQPTVKCRADCQLGAWLAALVGLSVIGLFWLSC